MKDSQRFDERALQFSLKIIALCRELRKDRTLWVIVDQLLRSATSIGANVVEARAASSKRDYLKFFIIALKSANETKYWLLLAKESQPSLTTSIEALLQEAQELASILGASVMTLSGKKV